MNSFKNIYYIPALCMAPQAITWRIAENKASSALMEGAVDKRGNDSVRIMMSET